MQCRLNPCLLGLSCSMHALYLFWWRFLRVFTLLVFGRRICVFLTNALDHTKEAFGFSYSSWITCEDVPGVHCRVLLNTTVLGCRLSTPTTNPCWGFLLLKIHQASMRFDGLVYDVAFVARSQCKGSYPARQIYYHEGHVTQGVGLPRDTCHSRGQWLTSFIIIRPMNEIHMV